MVKSIAETVVDTLGEVSPEKYMQEQLGQAQTAAGGIEAVATVLAMENEMIPPTINLTNPDPECDLNYSPLKATKKPIKYAISNTFGFGGHNASLLFKKFE